MIHYNHIGYAPEAPKIFLVTGSKASVFSIRDTQGNTVFCGNLKENGIWSFTGEPVKAGDFSDWKTPGTYRIFVENELQTAPFILGNGWIYPQLEAVSRSFYYQRSGVEIKAERAGVFARPAAHPDRNLEFHPSMNRSGTWNAHGGWYDAGDYGKYIVNAGVTVATLLFTLERFPDLPNRKELREEVRFELEWFLRMQDNDGGVFFKVSPEFWDSFVVPAETIYARQIIGKSTASALNFAGACAHAHRIFREEDETFAKQCLEQSRKAYRWACENPDILYPNITQGSGPYGDTKFEDEFFWAEAMLFRETGDLYFKKQLTPRLEKCPVIPDINWRDTQNLGWIALAFQETHPDLQERARKEISQAAAGILERLETSPYRVSLSGFIWGSNGVVCNEALTLAVAYSWNPDERLMRAVSETADYIYGRNPVNTSFVTGSAWSSPKNPHHRISKGDDIEPPIPGLLAGGINADRQDALSKNPRGVDYPDPEPGKSYYDHLKAYASNEIAINWNAPLVFVLAVLFERYGKEKSGNKG
jgi:endoglucanase